MTHLHLILVFLLIVFIPQIITDHPPVVPLTNALTKIYCYNDEAGTMTIRCGSNEKIRMLDAYDVVVKNKSHLPFQCLQPEYYSLVQDDHPARADCKMPTSFISACSGRENCTVHMQQKRLISAIDNCHDELVDYTMAFFECISDVFIHDVCSAQAMTSTWGTLKTPNFPNPYTSNDDCWCKLSTQLEHQLLLSVIVFQLIPYDQQCAGAGLYLQSSDTQKSTQCTYLSQGFKYLSDGNLLYLNFYSRTSTVRGGFWIIFEANKPYAEVHLHCGSREKIGAPLSTSSPSIYNHGWSRLASPQLFDAATTMTAKDNIKRLLDRDFRVTAPTTVAAAFTYPHGRLTTFELDYGPKGWFLKYLFGSSNMTATRFLQTTTTPWPEVKWNSTWRYIRRPRPRIFTTRITTSTTTYSTILTATITTVTTRQQTTSTTVTTSTTPMTFFQQRSSSYSRKPWIYYTNASTTASTTATATTTTTAPLLVATSTAKTTLPLPTPWYPPAGPFDFWQWKWYTTQTIKSSSITTTTTTTITTTQTSTIATTSNPITSTTRSTVIVTNTAAITVPVQENTTPHDWLQWPHLEFTSTTKDRTDYDDDDYSDWPDYFVTTKIPLEQTSGSLLFFPAERSRKKFQQLSFFPNNFNGQFINPLYTNPTPQFTDRSQWLDIRSTSTRTENAVQQLVDQETRKSAEDSIWFNKTDLTIVGVSILFVILLVLTNLIVYAVRRHRHRQQTHHLFSGSSIHSRRTAPSDHPFQNTIPINSFNMTNNNNNDILPAVGEIVLWDNKDQGGYTIDNRGEWAKIDGRQWFGNNLLKNCTRASFSKGIRSHFQFIRQSNKKAPRCTQQAPPKLPPHTYKYPLLMDNATSLSPVPEVDDYRLSDMSSDKVGKTAVLVHQEQDHSDEYYKRIETCASESNYTTVHGNTQGDYSVGDQQTDRSLGHEIDAGDSVIISVPTMLRQEDDLGTISDAGESIYNPNYSIQSFDNSRNIPSRLNYPSKSNPTLIVGHCQMEFQPLDPNLLSKKIDPNLLTDHQQFYSYSHSVEFSAYDSGFFDDQATVLSDQSDKETNDLPSPPSNL